MQRFRMACELVRNGRIGKLQEANVWLPAGLREGPFKTAPVPEGLDWDFWQGQAPRTDYVPERCHVKFRYWYDYSAGTLTDWGAHHVDIAQWAIGMDESGQAINHGGGNLIVGAIEWMQTVVGERAAREVPAGLSETEREASVAGARSLAWIAWLQCSTRPFRTSATMSVMRIF